MSNIFESLPKSVEIYEVSPRDGLQNESAIVPLEGKIELIQSLVDAGVKRIEVTSFVSPKWIPQLADADALIAALPKRDDVIYSALCPNERGLERAIASGISEIGIFLSASETHNRKNINKTVAETLTLFRALAPAALKSKLRVRGYVSTVWGCPYEGAIDPKRALAIAEELLDMGCYQVSLGDTIGVGTPLQTRQIIELFLSRISVEKIAMHMHDTRGTALSNCMVGLDLGIRVFDSSVSGLGGCPYAPGAAGNLATEDLVYMLDGMGVASGVSLEGVWKAGKVAESVVGRALSGKVHQAGPRWGNLAP